MVGATAISHDFLDVHDLSHQSGLRRVALLLHSLDSRDREWLLHKLDHSHRPELHRLLLDLENLGIPPLPEMLRLALQQTDKPSGVEHSATKAAEADSRREITPLVRLTILSHEEVRCLASLLKREPVNLIAQLLTIRPWPWVHSVMNALESGTRAAVQTRLKQHRQQALNNPQASPESSDDTSNLSAWQKLLVEVVVEELNSTLNKPTRAQATDVQTDIRISTPEPAPRQA